MPSGVYIRTKPSWSKGLTKETDKRLVETSKKVSNALKGHIVFKKTRAKLHKANKGHKPWNTGLTKETDERLASAVINTKKRSEGQLRRWKNPEEKERWSKIQLKQWQNLQQRRDASNRLKKRWREDSEYRKKMTRMMEGENSPSWLGGISFEPYSIEFNNQLRELIRYRDSYKCQLCGMPECENNRKLSIHHIDYNKKNSKPNNLITLCISCNSKVNFNRDKWEIYFEKKIKKVMNQNKMQLDLIPKIKKKRSKTIEAFI